MDREDLEVSSVALEDAAPFSKRSIRSLSTDNNNGDASPSSSLANVLADPKFACLLQEASA